MFPTANSSSARLRRLNAASRDPVEMGRMIAEGAGTLASVNQLVLALRATLDRLDKSGVIDDLGAAGSSARRITAEVEKGRGWLHVLIYEEPEALRRLNGILNTAQALMDRAESGESAVGVLLSKDSAKSGRALLAALDALGRAAEKPGPEDGLLPALLFDPEYRPVARDLQILARNFREVSEKLARGEGVLGGLIQGGNEDGAGQAGADVRAALANLRAVTEKLLTYALGRGLERYDRRTIKAIAQRVADRDYRFSVLVMEIVQSLPFQMRKGDGGSS